MATKIGTAAAKLYKTADYSIFQRGEVNRPIQLERTSRLRESMEKYGFLPSKPIEVRRAENGKLSIIAGQHRLSVAEALGLPVYYVIDETGYDIVTDERIARKWDARDIATSYASKGNRHYQEALEFADTHGMPITSACAMLGGLAGGRPNTNDFWEGRYEIRDTMYADQVARLYGQLVAIKPEVRSANCIAACMAVSTVALFEPKRLVKAAKRRHDKLVKCATRDAYIQMFEDIYNSGYSDKFPLRVEAQMSMRSRNARSRG